MCGIFGYIGNRNAVEILLDGLRRLEYRGYDSAGLAIQTPSGLEVRRSAGRIDRLVAMDPLSGTVGLGHIRWAIPGLTVIPFRLLLYYIAVLRRCDVDQPRNLAKSVTVE